jgi:hypothetical protein
MGDETFESVVNKLADLDVQYLNLHREWRKEKALRERYEKALTLALMILENNNLMNDDYRKIQSIADGEL